MKPPKFWAILKLNGTHDFVRNEDSSIQTFLVEREAETEADRISLESNGKIKCIVMESKKLHVFQPKVTRINMNVLEAEQSKSSSFDLKSISIEVGEHNDQEN